MSRLHLDLRIIVDIKKNLDLRARFKFSLGGGFGVNGLLYFVVFLPLTKFMWLVHLPDTKFV